MLIKSLNCVRQQKFLVKSLKWSLSLLSNIVFSVIFDKMENKNRTCAIEDASILYD